jgi:hypothetical protein
MSWPQQLQPSEILYNYFGILPCFKTLPQINITSTNYRQPTLQLMQYLDFILRFNQNNNWIMKFRSSIFRLTEIDYIYAHITNPGGLHLSDSRKGSWLWGARRSYRHLCKSFRVTDTMDTTPCGSKVRDPVGSIPNCYQRCLWFTSLSEDRLS